ncbi:hypothetical protein KJ940_03105 [Myxococcota bacterium]|nr:hypothetical protein [Myxococcota bacterium]
MSRALFAEYLTFEDAWNHIKTRAQQEVGAIIPTLAQRSQIRIIQVRDDRIIARTIGKTKEREFRLRSFEKTWKDLHTSGTAQQDDHAAILTFWARYFEDVGSHPEQPGMLLWLKSKAVISTDRWGVGYRRAQREPTGSHPEVVAVEYSAEQTERARLAHALLQDRLAGLVVEAGLEPLSPSDVTPDFDLAWRDAEDALFVVEVKSMTDDNETAQMRVGLGQILHYRGQIERANPNFLVFTALAVERLPRDADLWHSICANARVLLVSGRDLTKIPFDATLFPAALSP